MKRVQLADIHLSAYKDDDIEQEYGLPRRLSYLIKAMNIACQYAIDHGITNVDIAGDLHNDKDVIYTDSQNAFVKYVIVKYPTINFTILAGNHDISSTGEYSSTCVESYKFHKNVTCVIDKPYVDGNICFVPYTQNLVADIKNSDSEILISHFGLSEALLQSGMSISSNIGLNQLRKFKLVILGHYHKPQQLENTYYVGSPVHINWNDKNESKRFLVIDTETMEVESIPLTGFFKEYKEFIIDDKDKMTSIMTNATQEKENGNIVKVRKKISEAVDNPGEVMVLDDRQIDIRDRGINMSMTDVDKFKAYISNKQIPEELRDFYLDIAKEITACK